MVTDKKTASTKINESLKALVFPIKRLTFDKKNVLVHEKRDIAAIKASLKRYGQQKNICALKDGTVIAGNGTLQAAIELGWTEIAVAFFKDEAEAAAFALADNKSGRIAAWDEANLANMVKKLLKDGEDLTADFGFTGKELDEILGRQQAVADKSPIIQVPKNPKTKLGQLYALGNHRVYCGDATSAAAYSKLMAGAHPPLMVTDPPYGVSYDADWRNEVDRKNGKAYGASAIGQVHNDDRVDWTDAYKLFTGEVAYIWHAGRHAAEVQANLKACGFEIRNQIIWAKPRFVISRGNYHWQHEPCWYAVKKGQTANWSGDRKQTTLWEIENLNAMGGEKETPTGHSTQKPVECMLRPILNNTKRGEAVYDPFCGSGTTVIAAERSGRTAYCMEISPAYCDVIVDRWEKETGKKAKLVGAK